MIDRQTDYDRHTRACSYLLYPYRDGRKKETDTNGHMVTDRDMCMHD